MEPTVLIYEPQFSGPRWQRKLLGLTLRERLEKSLYRDGAADVRELGDGSEVMPGPVVLVPSTLVATPKAFKALLGPNAPAHTLLINDAPVTRLDSQDELTPEAIHNPAAWIKTNGPKAIAPEDTMINVVNKQTARKAEKALINALRKPEDGLISRSINRPISLATTRWVARTTITPNQWTVFTAIVGLIGLAVMAQGGYWNLVAGTLLIHLSSVWDGCDGELARLKFQYSKIGEWLDTVCDDVVNSCLFLGLGLGVAATTGDSMYMNLGVAAVLFNLMHAGVVYHHLFTQTQTGYALDFKWWFEEGQDEANTITETMNFMEVVKLSLRRDFFVFFFFLLCVANLSEAAAWLAFIGVIPTFMLGVIQTLVVFPIRRRRAARRAASALFTNAE